MGFFNWLHHVLNPHCPDCRADRLREYEEFKQECEENKVCESCETLRRQLEISNHQNEQLLDKLIKEPEKVIVNAPVEVTRPRNIPWNMRRQMLEAEDREKARLMRAAPKPDSAMPVVQSNVNELEKELGVDDEPENKETKDINTEAETKVV